MLDLDPKQRDASHVVADDRGQRDEAHRLHGRFSICSEAESKYEDSP